MTVRHLEFLVEEPSMEAFLRVLLPRLLPRDRTFAIHSFRGKPDLRRKLHARLRGYSKWLPADWRIVVMVDRDEDDCLALKGELEEAAADVKSRLSQWDADLTKVYFIRHPRPGPEHESSLRRLVERVRPVWVILDTWSHYLKAHRVKDTSGAGEQGLLIGDVVDIARERQTAIAVSHHNRKNPSATAESGDGEGEYRDSTAIGAAVDMIVSMSRGKTPRARRLTPSGRWSEDPLTVVLEPGVGFQPAEEELEHTAADPRGASRPLADRVLLHLLRCAPAARPPARTLAAALDCSGRRYNDLRAALDGLLDAGRIDHDQRPGTSKRSERGYALTPEGRTSAELLRERCVSGVSANGNEA